MAVTGICPSCSARLKIPDSLIGTGKPLVCPKCKQRLTRFGDDPPLESCTPPPSLPSLEVPEPPPIRRIASPVEEPAAEADLLTAAELSNACTSMNYESGLPVSVTSGPVKIAVSGDSIKIARWGLFDRGQRICARIGLGEVTDVRVFNSTEWVPEQTQERSVIGRGIVGGLLLGPVGAVVGGMSGVPHKIVAPSRKVKTWFVEIAFLRNGVLNRVLFQAERAGWF